jgi:hypothetical protein
MLLLVQVKMEGWDRSDTIGLSAVSDLVSLNSAENDLLVFVGSAGTLKFRFELDARTTIRGPEVNYDSLILSDNLLEVSLRLNFTNFSKFGSWERLWLLSTTATAEL